MGAVHNSMTFSCVFMLVQLKKCVVVYGYDLSVSHWFKRYTSMIELFVFIIISF